MYERPNTGRKWITLLQNIKFQDLQLGRIVKKIRGSGINEYRWERHWGGLAKEEVVKMRMQTNRTGWRNSNHSAALCMS